VDELVNRIKESELDFKNGKFKTQDELEQLAKDW
jgi:hypothetical protein